MASKDENKSRKRRGPYKKYHEETEEILPFDDKVARKNLDCFLSETSDCSISTAEDESTTIAPSEGFETDEIQQMENVFMDESYPSDSSFLNLITNENDVVRTERIQHTEEGSVLTLDALSECDTSSYIEDDMYMYSDDSDIELDNTDIYNSGETLGNDEEKDNDKEPLYPGSTVTVGAFMLLFTIFCMKQNLVGDGILQLLNIIAFILPSGHQLCTSLHEYKKFFKTLKNPLIKHYYCNYCLGPITDSSLKTCPFPGCNKTLNKNDISYFIEVPVETQVQNLFSQNGFYESLKKRFEKSNENSIYYDITDGSLYKQYFENDGPLSKPENLSFTFNTDGAPVFKSSKVSIWPLFMVVNELPYKIRMMKENMILGGLWFGNQKPAMSTFLAPFLKSFKTLQSGIECFSPAVGKIMSRVFLLCGTADLPARCLLCASVQYNGSFSCWKCVQEGETAQRGKGHAHVFPFNKDDPKGPIRTTESVIKDARTALKNLEKRATNYAANGVKGPSWLALFPRFHIIDGIAIDYMHGVLLGVTKLMIRLWFAPEFKKRCFSFFNHVENVDQKLKSIRPTLNITRLPRSIEHDLKYWKASEYRSFLLYYSLPVLHTVLDNTRFIHFSLLVSSIHILLKYGSSYSDLDKAETMLKEFVANFEELYDKSFMTLNVHQLIHLSDSVRCLGPLYTHSCFPFEDKNGYLLKMIRGTQNIDNQILTGVSFVQKIPELKQKFFVQGSDLEKLYKSIESPNILKRGEMITNGTFVLGALKMRSLTNDEFTKLCNFLQHAPVTDCFESFKRIEMYDFVIYGSDYARMTKRDNSTIMFLQKEKVNFGRVQFFIRVHLNANNSCVLAYTDFLKCTNYSEDSAVLSVKKTEITQFVPIEDIKEGCMYVSPVNSRFSYVCRFPNKLESD